MYGVLIELYNISNLNIIPFALKLQDFRENLMTSSPTKEKFLNLFIKMYENSPFRFPRAVQIKEGDISHHMHYCKYFCGLL